MLAIPLPNLDASLKSHRVAVEAGLAWGIAPGFERERVPPRVASAGLLRCPQTFEGGAKGGELCNQEVFRA